jgi:hypothetical protein
MAPSAVETNGNSTSASTSTTQSNGHSTPASSNGANDFSYAEMATPYRVLPQYHSKPTKLRVACVGSGASGLCLAYKMVRLVTFL